MANTKKRQPEDDKEFDEAQSPLKRATPDQDRKTALEFRLPSVPCPRAAPYPKGPTPCSYWAIPGRLLVSRHPGTFYTEKELQQFGGSGDKCAQAELKALHNASVRVWVRLNQENTDPGTKAALLDYKSLLPNVEEHKFMAFPMPADSGKSDLDLKVVDQAADAVIKELSTGSVVICVHCRGGHSRSGCVTARILSRWYGLTMEQALQYVKLLHATRASPHKRTAGPWPRQQSQMVDAWGKDKGLGFQVAFYRSHDTGGWMSNFYRNSKSIVLEESGIDLGHFSETDFQYHKALFFGDVETAKEIATTGRFSPVKSKELGRKVKGFKDDAKSEMRMAWEKGGAAFEVMVGVLKRKLVAEPELAGALRETGKAVLVEATVQDTRWANGLSIDASRKNLPYQWLGTNWLGGAWMRVRAEL